MINADTYFAETAEQNAQWQQALEMYRSIDGPLLPILEAAQGIYGELTPSFMRIVAKELEIPLAQVAGTASFYSAFNPVLTGEGNVEYCGLNAPHVRETRLLMGTAESMEPTSVPEYVSKGGYGVLKKSLAVPEEVINLLCKAKLRGRSGAAFPVDVKWRLVKETKSEEKFVICNASEGEPDTYKDLVLLKQTPHLVLEGMIICAAAVGARKGYIYVRREYSEAVATLKEAIAGAYAEGFLGKDILCTGHSFDVELRLGGGAYVCGEETGLIKSIEGNRGEPRLKPPFPGVSGLWGKPTVINNVETFANVPVVLGLGADAYCRYGTEKSTGTKLYTLSGAIKNPGVYEFPLGITMRVLYEEVGGGDPNGRALKGVQVGGGASGAIVGTNMIDTPLDMESCAAQGFALGTGSLMFFDEDTSVIRMAKRCMEFFSEHSCGKCTPCRFGTARMAELLDLLAEDRGSAEDLAELETMTFYISENSLCGLGQMAPCTVTSAIKHFRSEFESAAK